MVADRKRKLKDGAAYDHLFPPPVDTDTVILKSADVEDTMKLIRQALPKTLWQTKKIAKVLKGKTLDETCSNIWHFVYEHIQYRRDKEGVEQVRSPRRTWSDRKSGVDCDCYTVFILSILRSLNIPCLARITKYRKPFPEVPRWQHVYPIVPKPRHLEDYIDERDNYIVIDCVKDRFDDEQPYLECKDYDMRLDYLDGIDEEERVEDQFTFQEYESVDLADIASLHEDDEQMGNIFKKIGGAAKKAVKKVGTVAKKVGDKMGDGIRFLNRYINPATILLRNGFLLAMKINLMNVAGRLRYAYLTDAQAQSKGMNLNELKKLRAVKDRAETVYWQAGGKRENLKKAILSGKGNNDKKVPLSGFEGFGEVEEVYADEDEYNIIHSDGVEGLGEIASGTAIAAASSAVAAIAAALKQVKGLFNNGGGEEASFQSETDNAGSASMAPLVIPQEEEAIMQSSAAPQMTSSRMNESRTDFSNSKTSNQSTIPSRAASGGSMLVPGETTQENSEIQNSQGDQKVGVIEKTKQWVKENPGKTALIATGIITGGYMLMRAMRNKSSTHGLDGLTKRKKKKGKQETKVKKRKAKKSKVKIKAQNLL
jgi:hypothetical protein